MHLRLTLEQADAVAARAERQGVNESEAARQLLDLGRAFELLRLRAAEEFLATGSSSDLDELIAAHQAVGLAKRAA